MTPLLRRGMLPLAVAIALATVAVPARATPIALGAYIPGSHDDPRLIETFGHEVGRRSVIVASYKDWSSLPFDRSEFESIWSRGAVPMITWEPWTSSGRGFPLRGIAAGRYDRYLRRAAGSAALWGKPLLVRFAQEMNGTWFPWGRGHGNTSRDYRKAWKHIVNLFRYHGATNVKWVWSPNEDSGGNFQFGPYYPGDEWVDWVAIDGFNFGGSDRNWPSFTRIFSSTYDRLTVLTARPVMIAETAVSENGGDKAAWIASALGREAPRFSHLRALVWFDDAEDSHGDLRVNSSAASLKAFRGAVDSPAYAATRRTLLATPALLPGRSLAPEAPEGGYGAPSFFERLRQKLHGKYLWLAMGAVFGALLVTILGARMIRRGRRTRTAT